MSIVENRNAALLTGQRLIGIVFITIGIGFLAAWIAIPLVELILAQDNPVWQRGGLGYGEWLSTLRWLAYIGAICTLLGTLVFAAAKSVCLWCD